MTIPAPVISRSVDELPRASVIQPLTDITGSWAAAHDRERGLLYVAGQEAGPWGETVVHACQVD